MTKNRFEGMTVVDFFYRYIFRGIGCVFWAGVITGLALIGSQFLQLKRAATPASTPETHQNGGQR